MHLKQRIDYFVALGHRIKAITDSFDAGYADDSFQNILFKCQNTNPWFNAMNIIQALKGITHLTERNAIEQWLSFYEIPEKSTPLRIGVIMAGNIPLAGFHDFMCTVISGNHCVARLSSDDKILLPWLLQLIPNEIESYFSLSEGRLPDSQAIIATGSNNSSRYFEYYFKSKPHIIRKNRHSVAVLNGFETESDYRNLADDIFLYFGLGCRSITKLYVPENWNPEAFFTAAQTWKHLMNHNRYVNNYEYQKAVFLVNSQAHWDPGFMLMKEDQRIYSPVSVIHYQPYTSHQKLIEELQSLRDQVQCIVCKEPESIPISIAFGEAQKPGPEVYADHIDTLAFLLRL